VLGGKGRITGVVLASILILALRKSLQLMNVSGYTQGIAVGGVLIASLLVTNLSQRFIGSVRERRRPAAQLGADTT
jgi:rhamnose transport system permease protein